MSALDHAVQIGVLRRVATAQLPRPVKDFQAETCSRCAKGVPMSKCIFGTHIVNGRLYRCGYVELCRWLGLAE